MNRPTWAEAVKARGVKLPRLPHRFSKSRFPDAELRELMDQQIEERVYLDTERDYLTQGAGTWTPEPDLDQNQDGRLTPVIGWHEGRRVQIETIDDEDSTLIGGYLPGSPEATLVLQIRRGEITADARLSDLIGTLVDGTQEAHDSNRLAAESWRTGRQQADD